MVSEANSNTIGGIQDGRTKLITYAMEMPVPHSFYPQISEEGDIRKIESGHPRDTTDTVPIQEGRDHRRSGMCGSRTSMREHTTEVGDIRVYGVPEREIGANDLRQTSRTWEQV